MKPLAVKIDGSTMTLMPGCCIHWPIGEQDLLRQWVDALARTPDAKTILLGDSLDFARSHYRNYIRAYRDDENSQDAIDDYIRAEVGKLAKVLEPVRSKIVGTIRGNHFHEFQDGTNTEQYLCQVLRIPYLGVIGMVRFTFQKGVNLRNLVVYAHHSGGSVGARTTGGDVAGMERVEAGFDADVYLMGHTHRRHAVKRPELTITRHGAPRVTERTKVFVRCGAFLKGFKEDHPNTSQRHAPSYAELRSLNPTDLGWVTIKIKWVERGRKREDGVQKAGAYYPTYTVEY